ncbi:GNAT family N-acetyltransferase [Marinomonas mediterranea]|uniref:GCN5-related N-acetyltransferase n=1 Tax=Marinomonas mediterranea (strain ATCC 700492 / JCM 21426 / NBRC 103028 / MMB-1) TaxID=717774 RepID=F2K0C5_MARM1|nr:GNAT family N-acetyltransferase [Marinomonas mediterranea]ADZ89840.1 GCN5-related N-acetyltransferase [Marinomonas mediterranea MMB-1]WCN07928.1 GNAT family N-acetyltransferase [Marinomonas mediterranea]WCN12023.1 GNAT family N-acetyltransferase [Marinomonas mediterranea]WCN16060.1 GNAT family N-acetyltransferase [Marinomonas mediterranea MMB-1]
MKGYFISTEASLFDFDTIYSFLSESYWAKGIPSETLKKAIENSLCFAVFAESDRSTIQHPPKQIGFARMVTDKATFAYLADVFILEAYRGKGLSKFLMENIVSHPDLQGLRRIMLATKDAHTLYTKYGFEPLEQVDRIMQIWNPSVYSDLN